MAKVGSEGILCPSLGEAEELAMRHLFEGLPGVYKYYPGLEGNSYTTKGTGTGSATCRQCGKCIDAILTMKPIQVVDPETGEKLKVYDTSDSRNNKQVYKLGGTKCSNPSYPKQR